MRIIQYKSENLSFINMERNNHHKHENSYRISCEKERAIEVVACVDYLISQSLVTPDQRDADVVVLGDGILDVFVPCSDVEIEREGGVAAVIDFAQAEFNLGGGANVARGIAQFSRSVEMITGIGDHPYRQIYVDLINQLPENTCVSYVDVGGIPVKTRIVRDDEVVFTISDVPSGKEALDGRGDDSSVGNMLKSAFSRKAKSVIVSDYGRGVVTPKILSELSATQTTGTILIDPRPGKFDDKYNIEGSILKPNRSELSKLCGVSLDELNDEDLLDIIPYVHQILMRKFPATSLFMPTFDRSGAFLCHSNGISKVDSIIVPDQVVNPSGCGDIVASIFALTHEQVGLEVALRTGLSVASYAVMEDGTSTLSPSLLYKVKTSIFSS